MAHRSGSDTNVVPRQDSNDEHTVGTDSRGQTTVGCPASDCEQTVTTSIPTAGSEIRVSRRPAYLGDYEEVRCPNGHRLFVHYCRTE